MQIVQILHFLKFSQRAIGTFRGGWTTGAALGSIWILCRTPLISPKPWKTSCSTRVNSKTANFPLYSQTRLTLPLGVMRCASYTFNLALPLRTRFSEPGSQSNKDWEITLQSAPETSLKFTSVPAIFDEECQSSRVRHSPLDSKENARKYVSLPLPWPDCTTACTIFPPKSIGAE